MADVPKHWGHLPKFCRGLAGTGAVPIPSRFPVFLLLTEGVVTHICKYLVFSFNRLDAYFFKYSYSIKLTLNVTFPWI